MNLPPGFTSRPATPDDLDDVVALVQAWEIAHFGETEAVRSMLQYEWAAAWFDLERDAELIHDDAGLLVAYAQHATPDDGERFEAYGPVRPGFEGRGLGSAIVDWSEDRTRARFGSGFGDALVELDPGRGRGRRPLARGARVHPHPNVPADDDRPRSILRRRDAARRRRHPAVRGRGRRPRRLRGGERGIRRRTSATSRRRSRSGGRNSTPTRRGIHRSGWSRSATARSSATATTA